MSSLAAALIVSVLAGSASAALVMFFVKYRPDLLSAGIMASTAIRLLLMAAGTIIVLFLFKVDVIRFAIWVSVFYLAMLIWEIRFTLQVVNKVKMPKGDKV